MRVRSVVLGSLAIGVGALAVLSPGSAGTAQAVELSPPTPGVIVGLRFNHEETAFLANTPIPAALGIELVAPSVVVSVPEGSPTPVSPDGYVEAPMTQIWSDMAGLPNGRITVGVLNPGQFGNKLFIIKQVP
ncbi:hypothetical protein OG225_43330 (plasmid) [Nocardia sp. NBC_01377]|uniref:hypothetical protein n=1 Tax=Nocardia sp. NBC_01377 TaxID=2903595 RepID=UPI002F9170E8